MNYKKTIKEQAAEQGISISTFRRHIKQKVEENACRKAQWADTIGGVGWNPRAGAKKKNKGY